MTKRLNINRELEIQRQKEREEELARIAEEARMQRASIAQVRYSLISGFQITFPYWNRLLTVRLLKEMRLARSVLPVLSANESEKNADSRENASTGTH